MGNSAGGRPNKISHADVLDAARALGLSKLTVKAVAAKLGVSAQALYYHVKDVDDLRDQVAEHLLAPFPMVEDDGGDWKEWAYRFAQDLRAFYEQNPGLAHHATSRVPQTASMLVRYDMSLNVALRSGFRDTEAVWATRAVVEFVSWWVARDEARVTEDDKQQGQFRRRIREKEELVPNFARAFEAAFPIPPAVRFDFTVRALIQGLADTSTAVGHARRKPSNKPSPGQAPL